MLALRLRHHVHARLAIRRLAFVQTRLGYDQRSRDPLIGLTTPVPEDAATEASPSPFYFEAGYAGWAKRPTRPFPPPFLSPPSASFSDPLSTHHRSIDRRPRVNGQIVRGVTNGDDALLASDNLIGTDDGVGAWAQRENGHASLWSRLILHFWALAAERDGYGARSEGGVPDPLKYLAEAFEATKEALSTGSYEWHGTTTACSALLHFVKDNCTPRPVLYVTQLGDSKVMVVRPKDKKIIFETEEQWHYFDCPRQLGTNSPDTPEANAVMSRVDVQEDDMVLTMSDGVTDNLWDVDILEMVVKFLDEWREKANQDVSGHGTIGQTTGEGKSLAEGMRFVAQELVLAARKVAEDPFALSPFMERAVEEGLAIEGGKLDDISVVAATCRRRTG